MKSNASNEVALVAILRGVTPDKVAAIAQILYEAGLRTIEVPLNSPDPFASIETLAKLGLKDLKVGAGTVLTVEQVNRTRQAGGRLIVSPITKVEVIRRALELKLDVMPGFGTATEAFEAIAAGATDLKLFPAVTYGPRHLQALGAVLPKPARVFAVGGVTTTGLTAWLAAGAAGIGFGSEIFRPHYSLADIQTRAQHVVQSLKDAQAL